MSVVTAAAGITFTLPPGAHAGETPEERGLARDGVRLLVASPSELRHRVFADLPQLLSPGDLVVVNTSGTLPAAVDGVQPDGSPVVVHVSTQLDDGDWVVELRRPDGHGPMLDGRPGDRLRIPGRLTLTLRSPYPDASAAFRRLWRAHVSRRSHATSYLVRHGRPIEYGYLRGRHPLSDHQTVYATTPGSAEMPSAGRPFTAPLLVALMSRGITVAPVVLHAGVSSMEASEPPLPERFDVPTATARLVTAARAAGRRVVAVGTTVVRALETAATVDGVVSPMRGWTDLVLGTQRPARVVNALITGLHEPQASHLQLLQAVAGTCLVQAAYDAAVAQAYLWHEFGDSMLLLPDLGC